ncbi:MAG: sigma-70 family RNA polymerase sigma factor [Pirellula sp.]
MQIDSESSGKTRASLISRAKNRQPDAWSELVDLYGPLVAHWCARCGMDSHTTADCVQEVFSSVSRSLDRFTAQRASGAFRAWLWVIASNKIKDEWRRRSRNVQAVGGSTALGALQNQPDGASVPDDEPSSSFEMKRLVARGLEQIKAEFEVRTWLIFERSVVDSLSTEAVATEFGVSPSAVRQIRSRVLRRLRKQLGDDL